MLMHMHRKKVRVFTEEVFLVYFPVVVYTAMTCISKIYIVMPQNFEYMLKQTYQHHNSYIYVVGSENT